jgi:hypothetical protein
MPTIGSGHDPSRAPPASAPSAPASTPSPASAPSPAAAPSAPLTLGDYLEKNPATKLEDLQKDGWKLTSAARELLKGKGIDSPTQSQLAETQHRLASAIAEGKWKAFSAPFEPSMIKLEDGVGERLGNIFFEKHAFSEAELTPDRLRLSAHELKALRSDFESARAGMVLAASFISAHGRAEGDFSRAYGDVAWRGLVRATTLLDAIPKGKLLEQLDATVVCKVNEAIHAPDTGMRAWLLRGIAAIGRGGRWDKGGELREGRQFARPDWFTREEIDNLVQAGVTVRPLNSQRDGRISAHLEYPLPEEVPARLDALIAELKTNLSRPEPDVFAAASSFQRGLVALHPFGDSNGRTSRVLMNRILAEYDFPPAILRDQGRDISTSPERWRREVAEGVARAKKFLGQRLEAKDGYSALMRVKVRDASPDVPVVLDGNPFDLGRDGLLYDPTGRPHLVVDGKVQPLAQLEHYVLSRRVMMMGQEKGTAALTALTRATVELYDRAAADPAAGKGMHVVPDLDVRQADSRYELRPTRAVGELLVGLTRIADVDPKQLLSLSSVRGTERAAAMSKYAQVDLEYWYLERGLRATGQGDLADEVRTQRALLFDAAREKLLAGKLADRVSDANPMGFKHVYEQRMFEASPLRFSSLAEAVGEQGDDRITVWRGDYSFARLIGMAPNNDVRQDDAKTVARTRMKKGAVTNLYDDLQKLEGSAIGRQYICMTSDLSLLTRMFAGSQKSQPVRLDGLPDFIADRILAWLEPSPAASSAEAKAARVKENEERKAAGQEPLPDDGSWKLADRFGVPGTLLQVRVQDEKSRKLEVTAHRKAFALNVDKDSLLPGVVALGGGGFEHEQEMHGLERVYPWHVKAAYEAKALGDELPVTRPPAPAPAPAGPAPAAPASPAAAVPAVPAPSPEAPEIPAAPAPAPAAPAPAAPSPSDASALDPST